jgi:hypothetical protein
VEISEDLGNIVGDLTEAPNPSSEEFINVSDPSLTSEGKPRCITKYFKLLHLCSFILMYLYYALRLGVEMEP